MPFNKHLESKKKIAILILISLIIVVTCSYIWKSWTILLLITWLAFVFLLLLNFLDIKFKRLKQNQENLFDQNQALLSLYYDIKPVFGLPQLRKYAASPDFLKIITETISIEKPDVILECGSGASTIVTAYMLKKIGKGKVYSLDHDAYYGNQTRERIVEHGLQDFAEIIIAPLKPCTIDGQKYIWYDFGEKLPKGINMVIVDGPPSKFHADIRYPVFPITYPLLRENSVILLDDYQRTPEKRMVKKWMEEFSGLEKEELFAEKGTCLLRVKKKA